MTPTIKWKIVTTEEELAAIVSSWSGAVAVDVETALDKHLLGVSLSPEKASKAGVQSCYIPITVYQNGQFVPVLDTLVHRRLRSLLCAIKCIGHNFTYDKKWIDSFFQIESNWAVDTRIAWHLASTPSGPRPYGLKDAQKEVLEWETDGGEVLESILKPLGGSTRRGEHYMAPLPYLAEYAALDAYSTAQVWVTIKPFFDENDYHWMLSKMMSYQLLLEANTAYGVAVDVPGLEKAHKRLLQRKEAARKRLLKELVSPIAELEKDWVDRRIAAYKRDYNKEFYAAHPEKWERFKLNSDSHKRELFYDKLKLPVLYLTEGGLPKTDSDSVRQLNQGWSKSYLTYEKANTLTSNFSGPYLDSTVNGRLHPRFNICATVSYRLGGFKPYLLNAPFDEAAILSNLRVDEGYIGIHADLSAVEPSITAHYSEDPALLKVFQSGLGDIYLDLALELFPNDRDLQVGYNPQIPIKEEIKKKLKRQRGVSKVVQLAVQYTGTGNTVARNLTKQGFPTTVEEASGYVRAYWNKFRKVAEFNYQLRELNRSQGHLRNVIGRIIQVPDPEYKDLPNRFIQSSGHDVLVLWVLEIYRLCKEQGIKIKPVLLDCHDSTSNQCPIEQAPQLEAIYTLALANVNKELGLSVTIKCEMKRFKTLAGLKGDE